MNLERRRDGFSVSTDPSRLDLDAIHAFLSTSYWAEGIPRELLGRLCAIRSASGSTTGSGRWGWRG